MIAALLHSTNYQFSFYAMPTLVTSVGTLLLALLVLSDERFSLVSVSFLLVGLAITLWLGAFTFMYLAADEPVALWWSRAAYLGVPFIPITIYQFTIAVLQIHHARRWFLGAGWALSLAFSVSIFSTDWLIAKVHHFWWGYYPQYGWLSIPYLVFFFGYMILSLWEYRVALRGVTPSTIYRLAQQGLLPGLKVGGPWRFSEQMLESWAADQVTVERLRAEDQKSRSGRSGNPHRTTAKE